MVILIEKEKMVDALLRNSHCPGRKKDAIFVKIKGRICKIMRQSPFAIEWIFVRLLGYESHYKETFKLYFFIHVVIK
jgi:hypothetical protein